MFPLCIRNAHSPKIEPERNRKYEQITNNEIESVILKLLAKKKSPGTGEVYQTFREELTSILLKLFPKKLQRKEHF